jgi:hypothetical protein
MANQNIPNQASNMEQAEGSRENVDATLNEQGASKHQQGGSKRGHQSDGGITNRPVEEEVENQRDLPPRGQAKNPAEDHA